MFHNSLRLIGYVRCADTKSTVAEQIAAIKEYCRNHKHMLVEIFTDGPQPGVGLAMALQALDHADGLIVTSICNLVSRKDDALLQARPIIDANFMHGHRKLISLYDGIETVTASGEGNLMNLLNEWSLREGPQPTMDVGNHEFYATNY